MTNNLGDKDIIQPGMSLAHVIYAHNPSLRSTTVLLGPTWKCGFFMMNLDWVFGFNVLFLNQYYDNQVYVLKRLYRFWYCDQLLTNKQTSCPLGPLSCYATPWLMNLLRTYKPWYDLITIQVGLMVSMLDYRTKTLLGHPMLMVSMNNYQTTKPLAMLGHANYRHIVLATSNVGNSRAI